MKAFTRRQVPAIALVCGLLLCGSLHSAAAADLEVSVQQVKPGAGSVLVALYDKAAAFPSPTGHYAAQAVQALADPVSVVFHGLPPGRYAVAVYQDENGNGKLDKNLFGLPTEPYGFSNDASAAMGPPSFDTAAINVPPTGKTIIKLR